MSKLSVNKEYIHDEIKPKTISIDVIVDRWCPDDCKNFRINEDIDGLYENGTLFHVSRNYTCCNRPICQELRRDLI